MGITKHNMPITKNLDSLFEDLNSRKWSIGMPKHIIIWKSKKYMNKGEWGYKIL